MMEKKPSKPNQKLPPKVREILDTPPSHTDVQGMYTGVPWNENEEPVQDADDL